MSLTRARVGNEVDKRRRRGVSPYVGQGFKKVLNMNANGWSRKGCKDVKVAKELKLKGSSLGRTVISGSTGYDELYKCRKRETVEKSHSSLLLLLLSIIPTHSSKIFTGLKFRQKLKAKYIIYFQPQVLWFIRLWFRFYSRIVPPSNISEYSLLSPLPLARHIPSNDRKFFEKVNFDF